MININNVTVSYDSHSVLNNFSIHINRGAHIAIMGESGSGKTTLLKLIAKQLPPTKGDVMVNATRTSYMFQEPRLLPWLNIVDNVNLVLGDTKESLPEAIKWLKKIGLENDLDKYPYALSGGMQQRTALARALAYNGDLLLLDEPLSSLDDDAAKELLQLIKTHTEGKTVILVTHNKEQAKAFADTIYVLKKQTS